MLASPDPTQGTALSLSSCVGLFVIAAEGSSQKSPGALILPLQRLSEFIPPLSESWASVRTALWPGHANEALGGTEKPPRKALSPQYP